MGLSERLVEDLPGRENFRIRKTLGLVVGNLVEMADMGLPIDKDSLRLGDPVLYYRIKGLPNGLERVTELVNFVIQERDASSAGKNGS